MLLFLLGWPASILVSSPAFYAVACWESEQHLSLIIPGELHIVDLNTAKLILRDDL